MFCSFFPQGQIVPWTGKDFSPRDHRDEPPENIIIRFLWFFLWEDYPALIIPNVMFVIFHLLKNWKGWNKKHSSQKDRSFRIIEFQLHNNAHFSAAPVVSIKGFNQQLFSHSATRDGKRQNLEPQTRGQKIKAKLKKKKTKTWISITGWKCGKLAWT